MFVYEKRLQYPIHIKNTNPRLAKLIISQYGGPHGEIGASLRYLSQRYAMPVPELKAILTDIGTEELSHLEMVGTIVYQLTRNMTPDQIKAAGFDDYFVDHTAGVYPVAASGTPFNANTFSVTGDTIADLHEDMSAEQKARMTYDNILRFTDDPDVRDPIKFLREREIVHFQRFGEANHTKLSKNESPAGHRSQGIFTALSADLPFPITLRDVVPGLVVEVGVVIRNGGVDPGSVDLHQLVHNGCVGVFLGSVLNEPLIDLADGPVVRHGVTAGGHVVKAALWDLPEGDEVIGCFLYGLTVKDVGKPVDAQEGILAQKIHHSGARLLLHPSNEFNEAACIEQCAIILHSELPPPSQRKALPMLSPCGN